MYQPVHFREERLDVLHGLIASHPLGLLVTAPEGRPIANPVPFMIHPDLSPLGTLRAHLARANPQAQAVHDGAEALVVFQGPQAYVTPSWYATKHESGKVVPTWNYVIVQARGILRLHDDPAWLRVQIDALTARHETGRPEPWAVSDAPEPFIAAQIRAIVGVEIAITEIEGKWKVSQNRPVVDREGVAAGLAERVAAGGDDSAMAAAMEPLVRDYGGLPPT